MSKPKVFVGSSVEGLEIAYAIQNNLQYVAEITVWDQGIFELSQTTIESLTKSLENSDFAIFVFSPDDITKMRDSELISVRDNVIFELGLFIGKIGRDRVFIVCPNSPTFHIPTDLLGVTTGKFDPNRSDGSLQSATGPVCFQIRNQISKFGSIHKLEENNEAQEDELTLAHENMKELSWFILYFRNEFVKALEKIEQEILLADEVSDNVKVDDLNYWKYFVNYKIDSTKTLNDIKIIIKKSKLIDDYKAFTKILLLHDELELFKEVLDKGVTMFPKEISLINRKAEYLDKIGKTEEGLQLLLDISDEIDENIILKICDYYDKCGDKNEEFFFFLSKKYKSNLNSEEIIYRLSRLCQNLNKDAEALSLLDKLVKMHPENSKYMGYLGNSCVALGLNNKAIVNYKKASEILDSKESWLISNIGNVYNNLGLYNEAKEYLLDSLKLDESSQYAHNRISTVYKNIDEEDNKYQKIIKEGIGKILEDS